MTFKRPALDALHDRLTANGVAADSLRVASAILDLSREKNWSKSPNELVVWLEQLAFDVARSWHLTKEEGLR